MKHLAIFKKETAEKILTGSKTIECRFSRLKTAPFGQINCGDLVYVKLAGKDIIGQFRVKKVIFIDGVTAQDLEDLKKRYQQALSEDEKYWLDKSQVKYLTIIFIGDSSRFITSPIKIHKKDSRGWVVLEL